MNVAELRDLDPSRLSYYALVRGWKLISETARRQLWQVPESERIVFIPKIGGSGDIALTSAAINDIALAEHTSPEELSQALKWTGFDRLRVSREVEASALPVDDAVSIHSALRNLVLSAARAAETRRKAYSGGRLSPVITSFMKRVLVFPARSGSFMVDALLPLNASSDEPMLPVASAANSPGRDTTELVLSASLAALNVATDVFNGSEMSEWDSVVQLGVSANLCEAISELTGAGSISEGITRLSIDWTWDSPHEQTEPVVVNPGITPALLAGSSYLRNEPELFSLRLVGLITKLHREESSGGGDVTIKGAASGEVSGPRTLIVTLDTGRYDQAIELHQSGSLVVVEAYVRRERRGFVIERLINFEEEGL